MEKEEDRLECRILPSDIAVVPDPLDWSLRAGARMARMRALIALCSLLVAGCVSPESYRILKVGESFRIYQPNTRALNDSDSYSVDVLDVIPFNSDCRGPFEIDGLSARRVSLEFQGRTRRALRFTHTSKRGDDPVEDRKKLETALATWWDEFGESNPQCFSPATRESVIRSVMSQRPMTPEEAIADWYGPGPLPGGYRAILLRPGMRVCVSDVMPAGGEQLALDRLEVPTTRINDALAGTEGGPTETTEALRAAARSPIGFRLAGSSCARLAQGVAGPTFDPVASRLNPKLREHAGDDDNDGRRTINSWAEIEPVSWNRSVYLVIQPVGMPTAPPRPGNDPDYNLYSVLVIAKPDAQVLVSPRIGPPQSFPAIEAVRQATLSQGVEDMCNSQGAALRCIRFGERGVFAVDFPVFVNGQQVDVPVGATVETVFSLVALDFLAQDLGRGKIGPDEDPAAELRRARLRRELHMRRWFEGRQVPVVLDASAATLPLQPGDEIRW